MALTPSSVTVDEGADTEVATFTVGGNEVQATAQVKTDGTAVDVQSQRFQVTVTGLTTGGDYDSMEQIGAVMEVPGTPTRGVVRRVLISDESSDLTGGVILWIYRSTPTGWGGNGVVTSATPEPSKLIGQLTVTVGGDGFAAFYSSGDPFPWHYSAAAGSLFFVLQSSEDNVVGPAGATDLKVTLEITEA